MIILNGLLIQYIRKSQANLRNGNNKIIKSNKFKENFFLIVLTIAFVILTTPSLVAGYYLPDLLSTHSNQSLLFFLDSLQFTYYASNFFILYLTNKRFKTAFKNLKKSLFKEKINNRVAIALCQSTLPDNNRINKPDKNFFSYYSHKENHQRLKISNL